MTHDTFTLHHRTCCWRLVSLWLSRNPTMAKPNGMTPQCTRAVSMTRTAPSWTNTSELPCNSRAILTIISTITPRNTASQNTGIPSFTYSLPQNGIIVCTNAVCRYTVHEKQNKLQRHPPRDGSHSSSSSSTVAAATSRPRSASTRFSYFIDG